MLLKQILKKLKKVYGFYSSSSGQEDVSCSCEHGNEHSVL